MHLIQPKLFRYALSNFRVISSQHHRIEATLFESTNNFRRFRAEGILRAHKATHALAITHQHCGLPISLRCNSLLEQLRGDFVFGFKEGAAADGSKLAIYIAYLPLSTARRCSFCRRVPIQHTPLLSFFRYGLPQRMVAVALEGAS